MAKAARLVSVSDKETLSPNMKRVTLAGDTLADFPCDFEGGYVKLVLDEAQPKPTVRSYTIRSFDPDARELVIDMVAKGDTGPAATWANHVTVGEAITITGPGATQRLNLAADWFLLAGDMSAMPAICVNLELLPPDAQGDLVLEVIDEADRIELDLPPGITVHWVVNPDPASPNSKLEDTVMALPWRDGQVSVWVAGEFSASRALRQYFRHERKVDRSFMYISCYWKIGDTDEGMKAAKRADAEAW